MEHQQEQNTEVRAKRTHIKGSRRKWIMSLGEYAKIGVIYLLISLILYFPISSAITNVAPGVGGDTYQNLWDIWWVNFATFTLHNSFYTTHFIFWPVGANLIFQTMPPIFAFLSLPFQMIAGVPFAYNVMLFLGFAFAGIAMYILAEYLTKNRYAAFLAGLIFAFSAWHSAQALNHIEWINIEWVPLAIFFLIKMIREDDKYRNAVGLGISMLLTIFMAGFEQASMLVIFLVLVGIAYLINKNTRAQFAKSQFWIAMVVAVLTTFILGIWGFIPLITSLTQAGGFSNVNYLNSFQYNVQWSDDVLAFFLPSYWNAFTNGLSTHLYPSVVSPDPTERTAYIGYVALLLGLYGIIKNYKTVNNIKLWIGIWVIAFLMALGPYLQIAGIMTQIPTLYQVYHALPVIGIVREPGRFDLFVTLATAVLAAFGAKSLLEKQHDKDSILSQKGLVVGALAFVFLMESVGLPISSSLTAQMVTPIVVPALYTQLSQLNQSFTLLSLPALPDQLSTYPSYFTGMAMYYASVARKQLVGGYQSRENTSQQLAIYNIPLAVQASNLQTTGLPTFATPVLQNLDNLSIFWLYNYNVAFVILNKDAYNTTTLPLIETHLQTEFGNPVYFDNTTMAYQTTNAINSNLYRSVVAFPVATEWSQASVVLNNTNTTVWLPTNPGAIIAYAPYPANVNVAQAISTGQPYTYNATMNFSAIGAPGTQLVLEQRSNAGVNTRIAVLNMSSQLKGYSIRVIMNAGPSGNTYFFIPNTQLINPNAQSNVAVTQIYFSKVR